MDADNIVRNARPTIAHGGLRASPALTVTPSHHQHQHTVSVKTALGVAQPACWWRTPLRTGPFGVGQALTNACGSPGGSNRSTRLRVAPQGTPPGRTLRT